MDAKRVLWISASPQTPSEGRNSPWSFEYRPPDRAIDQLRHTHYDAAVLDFPMPDWLPDDLFEEVQRFAPTTPVLIRDPQAKVSDAVRLVRLGVCGFLDADDRVYEQISRAIEERSSRDLVRLVEHVAREDWEDLLVGDSPEIRQVAHLIRMVGGRRATVLITGETGTGKEIAARALHLAGPRRRGPWVAVNCSALPENLLEDELFGHVRGAFTGAIQARAGRFEQAQGGTLFLDEIGDMPLELQAKLLRVLQEREFQRLGSSETIRADARVVAATNCDLTDRVREGRFREDLYYRLNVVPIQMPPLRQRRSDISLLARYFVDKICRIEEIPVKSISLEAADRLCSYSWPGNVRQLENAVEMATALSGERPVLGPGDFPMPVPARTPVLPEAHLIAVPDGGLDYAQTLAWIERSILDQALQKTGGNKQAAADMLHLKRTTLSAKVKSLESLAASN
jgi:DNA-binding NtrC family response regulator